MGLWSRAKAAVANAAVKMLTLGGPELEKFRRSNREKVIALPTGRNPQALNIPTFEDIAADPRRLYLKMRTSFPIYHAVDTHGAALAALDVRVIGYTADGLKGNPENKPELMSDQAQALQKLFTHSIHLDEMIRGSSWAYPLGLIFWQRRWEYVEGVGIVLNCANGKRHKALAGGRLILGDDFKSVYVEQTYNPEVSAEENAARQLSSEDWFVFMPLGGDNPNGPNDLSRLMLRSCGMYEDVEYSSTLYIRQFSLPHPVLNYLMADMAPGVASERAQQDADDFASAGPGASFAIGPPSAGKNLLDYLEPKGTGVEFLPERETREESKCLRLMNGTALLSDTRATGPSGSSKEARTQSNVFTACGARTVGEWLSVQAIPAMIEINNRFFPGSIPDLKPGELPPYVELCLPGTNGDTKKTEGPAADAKPADERPEPEGRTEKKSKTVKPVE